MSNSDDAKIIYTGPSPRGWHRLQQAAECLQKYAWSYEKPPEPEGTEKVEKTKSPALVKGSLIHLAMAQHYARIRSKQEGKSVDEWVQPEEAVRLIARLEKCEDIADDVIRVYQQYVRQYPYDDEQMKVLHIEELLQMKIADKYLFTGRMDLVYEDLGGRIWVCDHKSTGRLTSSHKHYYAVSGQLLGYAHLAKKAYGDRFAGVKLNLIEHGNPAKFDRLTLERSPNFEARFERIVVDIEESVERMKASGRAYDDWPKAMNEMTCWGRYGACSYVDQCRFGEGAGVAGKWQFKWD